MELRELQLKLPEITSLGAQLVAVSPQLPDNSLSTAEKLSLTFEILSDVGNKVARNFGIVFTLPETLRDIYKGFGIDLPASNGDQTFELPVPATYIINRQGIIEYAFVDIDYTQRMEPAMIVEILKKNIG